jgi:hypothetical protein
VVDDDRIKDEQEEYSAITHIRPDTAAWLPYLFTFNIYQGNARILPRVEITLGKKQGYEHYWREDVFFLPLSVNQQQLEMSENDSISNHLVRTRLFYSDDVASFDSIPGFYYSGYDSTELYKLEKVSRSEPFQSFLEILFAPISPIMVQMISVRGLEHVKPELWADTTAQLYKGLPLINAELPPKGKRGGSQSPYDFKRLPEFYEESYNLFKSAITTAKTIKHLSLDDQQETLSKATQGKIDPSLIMLMLKEEAYISTPSQLAAERAARLCGVPADRPDGKYSPSYILQLITGLRKGK